MEMIVMRGMEIADSICGEMLIGGQHAAYTLERPGVAIPAGRYKVGLYPSPHFQRLMPILQNVPGRNDILLHWGTLSAKFRGLHPRRRAEKPKRRRNLPHAGDVREVVSAYPGGSGNGRRVHNNR